MIDRRSAELIDQIWQTDELRLERPSPVEEARSALYYLVQVADEVMPTTRRSRRLPAGAAGIVPDRSPIRFGSWVGGDRDGNPEVTPATTLETLVSATRSRPPPSDLVDRRSGRRALGVRASVADERRPGSSLAETASILPEVWQREGRRTAAEPYRLKCSFIQARLINTNLRMQQGLALSARTRLRRSRRSRRRPRPHGLVPLRAPAAS